MKTCPLHRVVVLEQTDDGLFCFLCKTFVDPVEVSDPSGKLLTFQRRAPPSVPDDGPKEGTYDRPTPRGSFKRAIDDLLRKLAQNPSDARLKQKLGELFQKGGDNASAADYFAAVAESYAGDGFALRALAVYKQVIKLDPSRAVVRDRLADLYVELGLNSDAMTQLNELAALFEQRGDYAQLRQVLERMLHLVPGSAAVKARLAELVAILGRE